MSAPPEPPVAVRLGDAAFEEEDYERAIRDYRLYLSDVDRGEYTARAFYKSALAAYELEDYAGALAILDELQTRYPDGVWVQVSALRGDALRELGKSQEAVLAWDRAWPIADEIERPKLRARVSGALAGLGLGELDELRDDVRSRELRALIGEEIATRTPPPIGEPLPPAVVVVPDEPAPKSEKDSPDTVVGALRELTAESGEVAPPPSDDTGSSDENVILEPEAEPVEPPEAEPVEPVVIEPVPSDPVAEPEAPAEAPDEAPVARVVKIERPLDPQSAVVEPEPAPAPQRAAEVSGADDGVVRLQRIDYPGAEPDTQESAPPVDSLEKLDVPADATP